ncbi:MAG: hypothetical protein KatS3mg030_542 [Saprospiraceae bacterium]|nr:MAG: hypothetical protein KatS3mg030_542 [Saprospiraceae bacterium]
MQVPSGFAGSLAFCQPSTFELPRAFPAMADANKGGLNKCSTDTLSALFYVTRQKEVLYAQLFFSAAIMTAFASHQPCIPYEALGFACMLPTPHREQLRRFCQMPSPAACSFQYLPAFPQTAYLPPAYPHRGPQNAGDSAWCDAPDPPDHFGPSRHVSAAISGSWRHSTSIQF